MTLGLGTTCSPGALFLWLMSSMSSSSSITRKVQREFCFVPYGESFSSSSSRPTISCDGRIPGGGVTLELTHWTGNETPDRLYADTSTGMALLLAKQQKQLQDNDDDDDDYAHLNQALVLNNHYDTDGVLSVWACLEPELALRHGQLLVEGAEAGDFGEWNSDSGVKLDCAVSSFLHKNDNNEEAAYRDALSKLPDLLEELENQNSGGSKLYEALWRDEFKTAMEDWESLQRGAATLERGPGKTMVILKTPEESSFSPYALHRGLKDAGLWADTTRILQAHETPSSRYHYRYQMPGHGWVKRLVDRHVVPSADGSKLVQALGSDSWTTTGGLTGICHTTQEVEQEPNEVALQLYQLDSGCK